MDLYDDSIYGLLDVSATFKAMMRSPMAFFAIAGIQQILASVAVILFLFEIFGTTSRYIWSRVLLGILFFDFGFNFTIAVYSSIISSYCAKLFNQYLEPTSILYQNDTWQKFIKIIVNYYRLGVAEAILTFIIALPCIIIIIIAFTDGKIKD